jgi:hypothetical protein
MLLSSNYTGFDFTAPTPRQLTYIRSQIPHAPSRKSLPREWDRASVSDPMTMPALPSCRSPETGRTYIRLFFIRCPNSSGCDIHLRRSIHGIHRLLLFPYTRWAGGYSAWWFHEFRITYKAIATHHSLDRNSFARIEREGVMAKSESYPAYATPC